MENKIEITASRLSISFADDSDIPSRFKVNSDKQKKINLDSSVEKRFRDNVVCWKKLIVLMLDKLNPDLAWRFLNISPLIDDPLKSVAYQKDFSDFNNYIIMRRNTEKCNAEELGRLAQLLGAFQRELESNLNQTN